MLVRTGMPSAPWPTPPYPGLNQVAPDPRIGHSRVQLSILSELPACLHDPRLLIWPLGVLNHAGWLGLPEAMAKVMYIRDLDLQHFTPRM